MVSEKQAYNFQRAGAISNAHVGREFENLAREYFTSIGMSLKQDFTVEIGTTPQFKKVRKFDLGSDDPAVLIECKSHRWTSGDKVPSAKMTVWTESMYYFHLAPFQFRKILFVLRDVSQKRQESLAEYYFRTYQHLIPESVEIWEYNETSREVAVHKI